MGERQSGGVGTTLNKSKRPRSEEDESRMADLTLNQVLDAMWQMLDEKRVTTKDDLEPLTKRITALEEENKELKQSIDKMNSKVDALEHNYDQLQNDKKKNNLIIDGLNIKLEDKEHNKAELHKFIVDTLGVQEELNVQYYRPVMKKMLLVSFKTYDDKMKIRKLGWKLEGTDYSIQDDLTYPTRRRRYYLNQIRKEILKIRDRKNIPRDNIKTRLIRDTLFIEGKRFIWREGVGIITNGEKPRAIQIINDLLQDDITPFIEHLLDIPDNTTQSK